MDQVEKQGPGHKRPGHKRPGLKRPVTTYIRSQNMLRTQEGEKIDLWQVSIGSINLNRPYNRDFSWRALLFPGNHLISNH